MMYPRRFGILIVVSLLFGCSEPTFAPMALERPEGTTETIFVATTRGETEDGWYSNARSSSVDYLSVPVNFPASYQPGDTARIKETPDPERDFSVGQKQDFDREEFASALRHDLASRPKGERDLTIYVHGFYNAFFSGVFRSAQLKEDFGLSGPMVHFSWPSKGTTTGYIYDRESLLQSRDGLEDVLRLLATVGAERVTIIGHSLGAMLVMETMRQIDISEPGWVHRNIEGLALVSPDVDLKLFQTQAARLERLPQDTVVFVSDRDAVLMLSSRLSGETTRLGSTRQIDVPGDSELTIVDVSALNASARSGHFIPATSPAAIKFIRNSSAFVDLFPKSGLGEAVRSNVRLFEFVLMPQRFNERAEDTRNRPLGLRVSNALR